MKYPTIEELQQKVKRAIDLLFRHDEILLELDVNERSISHKPAAYLQDEFGDEWDVDCEYNRRNPDNENIKKTLRGLSEFRDQVEMDDTNAQTVYPDIIVHHRNNDDNTLVIEIKKTNNARGKNFDLVKLRAYKQQLHYEHTLYLQLRTGAAACVDKEIWNDNE
jgi:hypothetical protein